MISAQETNESNTNKYSKQCTNNKQFPDSDLLEWKRTVTGTGKWISK